MTVLLQASLILLLPDQCRCAVDDVCSLGCFLVGERISRSRFRGREITADFGARNSHSEIDLILADYAMPTMSGIELAKAIRTTRPALPVILVTSYGNREVEGLSETRILQKPYTEDELILRIRRAFNER